jgi:hypothetical protein
MYYVWQHGVTVLQHGVAALQHAVLCCNTPYCVATCVATRRDCVAAMEYHMTGARSDLRVSSVYVPATAAVSTGVRCAVSAAPKEREIRSIPEGGTTAAQIADGLKGGETKSGRRRGDGERTVRNGLALGCALCVRVRR